MKNLALLGAIVFFSLSATAWPGQAFLQRFGLFCSPAILGSPSFTFDRLKPGDTLTWSPHSGLSGGYSSASSRIYYVTKLADMLPPELPQATRDFLILNQNAFHAMHLDGGKNIYLDFYIKRQGSRPFDGSGDRTVLRLAVEGIFVSISDYRDIPASTREPAYRESNYIWHYLHRLPAEKIAGFAAQQNVHIDSKHGNLSDFFISYENFPAFFHFLHAQGWQLSTEYYEKLQF